MDYCPFGYLCQGSLLASCRSVNMEWGVKENHVAVIALHNCGKSHSQIFKPLNPLKITRMFICWANKQYEELWRVEDGTWSGLLKSVKAEAIIKTVWEWIHRNLLWKQKLVSRKLNIIDPIESRLIRDDVRAHRRLKGHLTPASNEI